MTARARLSVYVQSRASRSEICGQHGPALKIRLAAAALDNAANIELIKFIARELAIPKRNVRILTGLSSRHKTLEIEGARAAAVTALRSFAATGTAAWQRAPSHRTAKRKVSDRQRQ
jgi:uncharacterized protein